MVGCCGAGVVDEEDRQRNQRDGQQEERGAAEEGPPVVAASQLGSGSGLVSSNHSPPRRSVTVYAILPLVGPGPGSRSPHADR